VKASLCLLYGMEAGQRFISLLEFPSGVGKQKKAHALVVG
jgi:hypothetical protein